MPVKLGTKNVGSIVKVGIGGTATDFIVVHQGIPDADIYDSSCDGTWVLMKNVYTTMRWSNYGGVNNDYENSAANAYLNGDFLGAIDPTIKNVVKRVKIPYQKGTGSGGSTAEGANGLITRVFLLSAYEIGLTISDLHTISKHGCRLAYFLNGEGADANEKRVAYDSSGSKKVWATRSPWTNDTNNVSSLCADGSHCGVWATDKTSIRPAFILPQDLVVMDDGTVRINTAPTVTASATDLGRQNSAFSFEYTASDADGDSLTVTEKLDGKATKTRTGVTSGTALTFEKAADATGFQKILNGNHVVSVEASDGNGGIGECKVTFSKTVYSASVTLAEPLAVDGDITMAVLLVTGFIPASAIYSVEVTNNALDDSPVWQNVTDDVKAGRNILFENKTAASGAAFNFRVTVSRGNVNEGGYIDAVSGAFQ